MLNYLKNEANKTYTENGAATYASSMSDCIDLFASIGALRNASNDDIISRFIKAYCEDPDLATKILFYARDVRGGLGERKVFRTIISWLAFNKADTVRKNIHYIAEFGRWDDLMVLLGTPCEKDAIAEIKAQLNVDIAAMKAGDEVSLLAKWLPSVNASNKDTVAHAKTIAKALGMTESAYRKTLSGLRAYIRIIENNLRERDYSFDYSKQPSKAMFKYRQAFNRNDGERYNEFLDMVNNGQATLHTGTLMPYEVIRPICTYYYDLDVDEKAIDTTWKALPDYTTDENALCVIDGSGSMYWNKEPTPASVALSLGIYFAERNKGTFANHFITFSEHPKLVEIKGNTISDKVAYCKTFNECANTNIQAVFELILNAAVKNKVPKAEMPKKLYIISDMEFDNCAENADMTNFEYAKELFSEYGYDLPEIVFWNVNSRNSQVPVTINDMGVALVSGCNPRVFSMVMEGMLSPYEYMMSVIGTDRYAAIAA